MSRATASRKPPRATPAALAALGAERLAELLARAAKADTALRRALTLEVARDADDLAAEIDRQLDRFRTGKGRLNAPRVARIARELDGLVEALASKLGGLDAAAAALGLLRAIELAAVLTGRAAGEGKALKEVSAAARERLAQVLAQVAPADQHPLVAPLHAVLLADAEGPATPPMVAVGAALHVDARRALRAQVESDLAGLAGGGRGGASPQLLRLTAVLALLADAEDDVDAFLAAQDRRDARLRDPVGSARRLLAADRAAQALAVLEATPAGAVTASAAFAELRIQVLDALGRREEAQAERWRLFQAMLSVDALRQHLKRMPDFEDVECEEQALAHVVSHADLTAALAFLTAWPDLRKAGAVVRSRQSRLDGDAHEVLEAAAAALAHRDPLAAVLLHRAVIDRALYGGARGAQARAARNLAECSALAASVANWEGRLDHAAYVARLRNTFGRRSAFWRIVAATI